MAVNHREIELTHVRSLARGVNHGVSLSMGVGGEISVCLAMGLVSVVFLRLFVSFFASGVCFSLSLSRSPSPRSLMTVIKGKDFLLIMN